ncbi:DUF6191 domain-containing protein [Streptomyces lavendulae]|uniref:DUF6191 domain-containing protein n=1 Tax=Streptomyces lavendulae TaxID=1914 RepID=UPI0024A2B0DC|nr:DUF6191 domain-containing protein [Streptomyces lavendulae]GLV98615.1 hypothetical protein Slala05_22470 [Streptomyces lavendulae subsp. lavendulae]
MGTVFHAIQELFNPGSRHAREERERLELSRTDVGDGDPGRGPIDLGSGRVLIRTRKDRPEGEADAS